MCDRPTHPWRRLIGDFIGLAASAAGASSKPSSSAMSASSDCPPDSVHDRAGDHVKEERDGPDRIVVSGDRIIDIVRIAVGVDTAKIGMRRRCALLDRDILTLGVDDEKRVGSLAMS
jgi:hypothetical protein